MAGDGVQRGTESARNEYGAHLARQLRARVIAWPTPPLDSDDGVYAIKIAGLGDAAAALGVSGRQAGLWVTADRGGDAVVLSGPAATLLAFGEHPAAPPGAAAVARALDRFRMPRRTLEAGGRVLNLLGRPLIVGILNATPDSFYDQGRYFSHTAALARADEMVAEGADVIEVGGESARPGAPIGQDEEIKRVTPLIEALAVRLSVPVAVDTYKAAVARRAAAAGAVMINDISGLADVRMAEVAAETGAALVVMHIQGRPKERQLDPRYGSVIDEVYAFLEDRTELARRAGLPAVRLIVDPGFSFGKTPAHDLEVLRRFGEFRGLGYPVYLATSRKNYIRDVLGLPFEELLEGTAAAVAYGVAQGAHLVRTHDVSFMRRVVAMTQMITRPLAAAGADSEALDAGDARRG
ncbi:MAG TPA: dihydropteroate synthase [bacterium]|nr:dihydropteroate synthase [bacterium]